MIDPLALNTLGALHNNSHGTLNISPIGINTLGYIIISIVASNKLRIYLNGVFVEGIIRIWNGTNWVGTAKIYNGVNWIDI